MGHDAKVCALATRPHHSLIHLFLALASQTCTERPRAKGAKFLPVDIKPDEIVKSVELDYDGKRDRWSGYRPELYQTEVVERPSACL